MRVIYFSALSHPLIPVKILNRNASADEIYMIIEGAEPKQKHITLVQELKAHLSTEHLLHSAVVEG